MQLDQNGLYDIYSIKYLPFWQQKWFVQTLYVGLCLIILSLLFFVLYRCIRWYKARQTPVIVQVIQEITKILNEAQKVPDAEFKLLYIQSVRALKRYYFHARGQQWLSATEDELMIYIEQWHTDQNWRHSLKEILQRSGSAKYAQSIPAREVVIQDMQHILAYLQAHANQDNKQ